MRRRGCPSCPCGRRARAAAGAAAAARGSASPAPHPSHPLQPPGMRPAPSLSPQCSRPLWPRCKDPTMGWGGWQGQTRSRPLWTTRAWPPLTSPHSSAVLSPPLGCAGAGVREGAPPHALKSAIAAAESGSVVARIGLVPVACMFCFLNVQEIQFFRILFLISHKLHDPVGTGGWWR